MLTPEAIDKLGIKFDGSTVKAYTPPSYPDIRSFIRCVLPSEIRKIGNTIARWIIDKHQKSKPISYEKIFFYLQQTHGINRNSNLKYAELVQRIYNAIFTGVCKVSLQRKNKPGRNSTWLSDLSIQNQQQVYNNINYMDNVPQGRKRVQPSSFNTVEPENIKVKLSWSNMKSNSLLWSNLKSNSSSWSNIKLDETSNIKEKNNNTTSSSNKLVPKKMMIKRRLQQKKTRINIGTSSL